MAWTSFHMAVGMGCTAALGTAICAVRRKGWRWLPLAMTAGALWAIVPDMPRFWREDFPSLPFAATLGQKSLENWLHHWGNVFFFHRALDTQPKEFALHGLVLMMIFYNAAIVLLMWLEHRARQRAD